MFFKTKKFIQNLKDSCGPRRVRGNFSQGGITSRSYRDDEIMPIKTPP
jgi:hypothetical protein